MFVVEVQNVPEWVLNDCRYIVATVFGCTLWFYGSSTTYDGALSILKDDGCERIIILNCNCMEVER